MIFSIGYSNRNFDDFILLLHSYNIEYLIDVRTSPYSKMFSVYNRETLSEKLKQNGLKYLYLGDQLGGLPKDPSCYLIYTDKRKEVVKKIDYSRIEKKDFFIKGIERLKTAFSKGLNLVIMCSELNPEECHRSKLIGLSLQKHGIIIQHINKFGKLISQNEVNLIINAGKNPLNLWGEIDMTSKRKIT